MSIPTAWAASGHRTEPRARGRAAPHLLREADRQHGPTPVPRGATVLGECVADAFVDHAGSGPGELALRALPGGGPANTAAALARLGTLTRFLGRFSSDAFGALFRARLAASGVDLTGSVAAPEASALAVADLDEAGQATYTFYADNAADWQWTDDELAAPPSRTTRSACTPALRP